MRKFLALTLILVIALLIVGCGEKSPDPESKVYTKLIEVERFSSMTVDGTTSIDIVYTHTSGKVTELTIDDENMIEQIMTEIFNMELEKYPEDQDIDFYYRTITVHQGDKNYQIVLGSVADENGKRYIYQSSNLCNLLEKYIAEKSHSVTVINAYMLENRIYNFYFPGEEVSLTVPTATENYYTFILNGVEHQATEITMGDTYFTFTMPNSDVTVEIVSHGVDIPEAPISFAKFLDEGDFAFGYSQESLKKYYYEGKPITEQVCMSEWEGHYGGGCRYDGYGFGFEHWGDINVLEGYSYTSYSFYTTVDLDGFTLPYLIDFGDQLSSVLMMMDIYSKPHENFSPDEEGGSVMTLLKDENSAVTLKSCALEPNYNPNNLEGYSYIIQYTDTSNPTENCEKISRSVTLYFSKKDNTFVEIQANVTEYYEAEKGYTVTIISDDSSLVNNLQPAYLPGEAVFIELETLTESSYTVKVNQEKIEPYRTDEYYTSFSFEMPKENVIVEISKTE